MGEGREGGETSYKQRCLEKKLLQTRTEGTHFCTPKKTKKQRVKNESKCKLKMTPPPIHFSNGPFLNTAVPAFNLLIFSEGPNVVYLASNYHTLRETVAIVKFQLIDETSLLPAFEFESSLSLPPKLKFLLLIYSRWRLNDLKCKRDRLIVAQKKK